jgi:general secretion pathway protein A
MYTKFYKLRAEPFLLTPDHRFFYESSVHSQAMAYLSYGLDRGEGFIVITGDIGAGKTTLVNRLCASIDRYDITAAHVVTTMVSGSDLLRLVAAAFGLRDLPSDKGELLLLLQNFFEVAHNERRRLLLIIDEAQNLTVSALEELRMLSNFQSGAAAPFQSFLLGQPQFRAVLAHPDLEQLRQRIIARYHLGPMDRKECGDYVQHRLRQVGWTQDPEFSLDALDAIYDVTGGIPRRINTLCNRLMLFGFLDDLHHFSCVEVNKVAADLDEENASVAHIRNGESMEGHRAVQKVSPNGSLMTQSGGLVAPSGDVNVRLANIEQRLSMYENIARRAASTVNDFLSLARSEPN